MILPVIMVGGTGSRLWPLSRELYPKQFLTLQGQDSLLQATVKRLQGLPQLDPLLICNEAHRFVVKEQLDQINQAYSGIILEPVGRNTAPALALAAFSCLANKEDPVLLALPADHFIADKAAFHKAVTLAVPYAKQGYLVTFGVPPSHPETAYGYIEVGEAMQQAYAINAFVEKPNKTVASAYLEKGGYYWNSGMFLLSASTYLAELKKYQPDIYKQCHEAVQGMQKTFDFLTLNEEAFKNCPADSIDYAVMEQTKRGLVVPLDAAWSDIGSWDAVASLFDKDDNGNIHQGDVVAIDNHKTIVHSDDKLVVTIGLDNMVVINTKDAVLVVAKDKVQQVKQVVSMLQDKGRSEAKVHREVYRPWGKYDAIDQGLRYQVKRITVKPGEKLSRQMHHHRAEHWVVVSGTAKVTNGDETYLLTENQSTFIPLGVVHSLENPGKVPLEIIEVQSGAYLDEDDIVRFEDRYGRALETVQDD
jgi:mannose-1-phosphate guanylyltransferase